MLMSLGSAENFFGHLARAAARERVPRGSQAGLIVARAAESAMADELPQLLAGWAEGGAAKTAALLARLARADAPKAGAHPLKGLLYELCAAACAGRLSTEQLRDMLVDGALAEVRDTVSSHLADVFWFMGLEHESNESERKLLVELVRELASEKGGEKVLDDDVLRARLEPDLLQDAGLIKDKTAFHKASVRQNTKLLYTQQKYNLFREESEGYSKLITELAELPAAANETTSTRGSRDVSEVVSNIQSLIGYFDLDPNRVLDLVLDALETVPSRAAHGAVLSLFNPQYVPDVLGFKFTFYQGADACPDSLYQLCGLLVQQETVRLEQARPSRCAPPPPPPSLPPTDARLRRAGAAAPLAQPGRDGQEPRCAYRGAARGGEEARRDCHRRRRREGG